MGTDAHKKWGLNTQKIKLEKAITFRLVTMRHWKPGIWPFSFLELLVSMEYCVYTWCLNEHRSCCRRNVLKDSVVTLIWVVDICSLRSCECELW